MSPVVWDDLEGDNAFVVLGTVGRLLGELERKTGNPALKGIRERYLSEAQAGNYEHLLDISHRYAREYLEDTLSVPEERGATA